MSKKQRGARSARASSRPAAPVQERQPGRPPWLVPAIGGAVVLVAAVLAIAFTTGSSPAGSPAPPGSAAAGAGASGGSSAPAVSSARPSGPTTSVAADLVPVISGSPLARYDPANGDPAVGQVIPTVTAPGASIAPDGRPKVVLFVAHWCPHCQAEVPRIQAWINGGGLPTDVDLMTVSTGIDSSFPNYPPEAWFAREGWTSPVISDPTNAVAGAFGLPSYPYLVFVNADGTVAQRTVGEVPVDQIEAAIAELKR